MNKVASVDHMKYPDPHQDEYSKGIFGFWVYIMTDCMLFATLFTTYAVLHNQTYGGPSSKELYNLPYALGETLILLTSSFICGLATIAAYRLEKKKVIFWFIITFLLGISFLVMEGSEFYHMVQGGNSWQRSAFLSSYFTLVGTHGLHISVGLIWMIVVISQVFAKGVTPATLRRLTCLSMFWHFLDVIWIFIFSIVYFMGVQ